MTLSSLEAVIILGIRRWTVMRTTRPIHTHYTQKRMMVCWPQDMKKSLSRDIHSWQRFANLFISSRMNNASYSSCNIYLCRTNALRKMLQWERERNMLAKSYIYILKYVLPRKWRNYIHTLSSVARASQILPFSLLNSEAIKMSVEIQANQKRDVKVWNGRARRGQRRR